jgi:hypothetical protein
MEFWVSGNWSSDYLTKANSLQPARSKAKGNSLIPQPPDYEEFAIVGKVAETRVGRNTWGSKGVLPMRTIRPIMKDGLTLQSLLEI